MRRELLRIILTVASLVGGVSASPADLRYYPETIDSLWTSTKVRVQITGTVAAVSLDDHRNITFRIGDTHGHFVGCVIPKGTGDQPRVGVEIVVSGVRKQWSVPERGQGVVEINPVERIEPVE